MSHHLVYPEFKKNWIVCVQIWSNVSGGVWLFFSTFGGGKKCSMSSDGFDLLPSLILVGSGSYVCCESPVMPVALESNLGLWYNYMVGRAPSKDIFGITEAFFSSSTFYIASAILNLGISRGTPFLLIVGGALAIGSILGCCVVWFRLTTGFGERTKLVQPYLLDKLAKWPAIRLEGWFSKGYEWFISE